MKGLIKHIKIRTRLANVAYRAYFILPFVAILFSEEFLNDYKSDLLADLDELEDKMEEDSLW